MSGLARLALSLLLIGCAAFRSVHYGKEYAEPTLSKNIELVSQEPSQKYTRLGEVVVFGVTESNRFYMLKELKEMAAEMGGDAIILQERAFPRYAPKPLLGIVIKWLNKEER